MIRATQGLADPPLPLLVTGVAGVGGYNAFRYFRRRYPGQVMGIRRADNRTLCGDGILGCNMDERDQLKRLFDRHRFAAVVSCEGNCRLKNCELDPEMAWRVNVQTMASLLSVIGDRDVRLIHLSVDLVFSGLNGGGYVETDPVDPLTVYGKTMAATEQLLLARRPDACVLRISLPMGISFNGHAGAIDWIQHRFRQAKPATLYYDEIRTPTYTECLNELCRHLLVRPLRGVYHAGGPLKLSLFQIAQIVNRVGDYDPTCLQGAYRTEAGPVPPRAGDVTMDSTRLAQDLGYEPFAPWPLDPAHVPSHHNWHRERPPGERRGPGHLAQVLYHRPVRIESP